MAVTSSEGIGKEGRDGGVALCVRKCLDCLELNDGGDRVQCLWERMVRRLIRQIF